MPDHHAPPSRGTDVPYYDDLDRIWDKAWSMLERAVVDRRAAGHTPVLATVSPDGMPQARTVVLRATDRASRQLRMHTDMRSGKVEDLAVTPKAGVLVYDKGQKIQLRLSGAARVETAGAGADAAWDASRLTSRRCYLAPVGPGTDVAGPTSGLPPVFEDRPPTEAESWQGRGAFGVVLVTVTRLEWLFLAARGHRRCVFDWADGPVTSRWLVP